MSINNLIEQAKDKVNQNDFDSALTLLNKALDAEPNHVDAIYERGVIYTNKKQLDLALFDFNRLVELVPNYPFYYSCRAFVKSALKDVSGAIADYEMAVKLDPQDAIAYNNLGLLQEQAGYKSLAEKSFEKSNENLGYNPNRYGEGEVKLPEVPKKEEPEVAESHQSKSAIIKSVFTTKSTFREFLNFIKNGFKIKSDDES